MSSVKGYNPNYKPQKATRDLIDWIVAELNNADGLAAFGSPSPRQVYYHIRGSGLFNKALSVKEPADKVSRILTDMRRARIIPFHRISDSTSAVSRLGGGGNTVDGTVALAKDILRGSGYRLDRQEGQPERLVIWTESIGMRSSLEHLARPYGIRVISGGGQPSVSWTHDVGRAIGSFDQPVRLLNFGDHDPGGERIVRTAGEDITAFAGNHSVAIERVALTEDQILDMDLPVRPIKRKDPEARTWTGINGDRKVGVDCEALPATTLRSLLIDTIDRYWDVAAAQVVKDQEAKDIAELNAIADSLGS